MENDKVRYLIDMINNMDIKDKLRFAICMSKSEWSGLIYNTKENYEKFNTFKELIEEYKRHKIEEAKNSSIGIKDFINKNMKITKTARPIPSRDDRCKSDA